MQYFWRMKVRLLGDIIMGDYTRQNFDNSNSNETTVRIESILFVLEDFDAFIKNPDNSDEMSKATIKVASILLNEYLNILTDILEDEKDEL